MYDEAMRSIGGPLLAKRKWGTYVRKATSNQNPQAMVAYRGRVHWFESGTSAHYIVSKKAGGTRKSRQNVGPGMFRRGRGAVTTPAGYRAYARHPGQRAEPFFDKAKDRAAPVARDEVRSSLLEKPLRSIF